MTFFLGDCSHALTGNYYTDMGLGGAVVVLVGLLARWVPGLGWLAKLLEALAPKGQTPPPAPLPPAPTPPALPGPDANEPVAAHFATRAGMPRQVAIPSWLSWLILFMPALREAINKALDALADYLGREPSPEEATRAATQAGVDWVSGKKAEQVPAPKGW